jgi:hypothetical protein
MLEATAKSRGRGEAETGPVATGWDGNKFLNPDFLAIALSREGPVQFGDALHNLRLAELPTMPPLDLTFFCLSPTALC